MLSQAMRLLVAIVGLGLGAVHAEPVAMVTDVQGTATRRHGDLGVPLAILSALDEGARIQLTPGSRLTVLFFGSGDEYVSEGPGAVVLEAERPRAEGGATLIRRAPPKGQEIRIRPASVAQGGMVWRSAGIRLVAPVATSILETSPEFTWEDTRQNVSYRFSLTDANGSAVYAADTNGPVLRLPATLTLAPGALYNWEVSVRSDDDYLQSTRATFRTASETTQAQVRALRPKAGADFAARVAFAVWLEQRDLRDEARRLWRDLASERPDMVSLRERAER